MGDGPQTELGRIVNPHTFSITADGNSRGLIPSNRKRTGIIIGNVSANVMFVNFNDLQAATQGLPIQALFGRLELTSLYYGNAFQATINLRFGAPGDIAWITEFVAPL